MARDDSVIRGSLITCMIFLVLSIALNFFLWRWGDTRATEAQSGAERLAAVQTQVTQLTDQATRMKTMLGIGNFTQAEIDEMSQNASSDPEMQQIEEQFSRDMSYFGQDVEPQNRNYPNLPQFLVNAIRSRNEQYGKAVEEQTKIRTEADADVDNARKQQQLAETQRDAANKKVVDLGNQYDEDRARMNQEKEETKDKLNTMIQDFTVQVKAKNDENSRLSLKNRQLQGTIDTQKLQLNELRSDRFETTQGEIRFVVRGGNVTTINLGSADLLRPGVTFGVFDADETRLQDARVKATIQVTQIQGPHLAQARVVARPEIRNPIIPGDLIFSPFWAPGREVKIALAGDIDIDGDGRPDNDAIKGMIRAAGAKIAAEVSATGAVTGTLDSSIRFMVVGEEPDTDSDDPRQADLNAQAVAALGRVRNKANELGLTVIPAWKLQSFLKTIDDTLTTPLGSAVRGEDFPPESVSGNRPRLPSDIAEIYKRQTEGVQTDNKILPP